MAITCGDAYNNTCNCACLGNPDANGSYDMDSADASQTLTTGAGGATNCCTITCGNVCSGSKFDDVILSGFRKQSGSDSSGKILGLTTQQALIAVGVGVAAYFIIKKVK